MRTSIAPSVRFQSASTRTSAASAASTRAVPRDQLARHAARRGLGPAAGRRDARRRAGARSRMCSAAHGSSPAPKRAVRLGARRPAGFDSAPLRPMNDCAIAGGGSQRIAQSGERDAAAKLGVVRIGREDGAGRLVEPGHDMDALISRSAGRAPSRCRLTRLRRLTRAGRVDNRQHARIFTGSAVSTKISRSCTRPRCTRENRVTPAAWRMTMRPLDASRRHGTGRRRPELAASRRRE